MLRRISVSIALTYVTVQAVVGLVSAVSTTTVVNAQGQPPRPGARPPTSAAPAQAAAAVDSFARERDSLMNVVLSQITGRENAPAESVFKNIKVMKGMPAGRLLRIMNVGYGRSLGVGCRHCHVPGEWDKEDKPQKQIARDMMAMTGALNNDVLPKIKNLKSEKPTVNCTTCHRGAAKPALNL